MFQLSTESGIIIYYTRLFCVVNTIWEENFMYQIATLNKISKVGMNELTAEYIVTENIEKADGILVRSADMLEMEFSDNLMAIARAGAGVNNIPLDRCAENGIVVFNTPGANANAVKELTIAGLFLG